jgi:DNA-damage-inducible protein J
MEYNKSKYHKGLDMKIQTSVRVEDTFYNDAKEIFQKFDLSFGDAVNIFLAKVVMEQGIPFDLTLPSDELKNRLKNIEDNTNTKTYKTTDELFDDLGI